MAAASEVSIDVHDHGTAVDGQKKRAKCNYCGKVVSGFSRLKCHLGGIRGDVSPCEQVPTDVNEAMKNHFLSKKKGYLSKEVGELSHPNLPWKRNWSHDMNETQTTGHRGNKRVEGSLLDNTITASNRSMSAQAAVEDPLPRQAQKCIGRFFYETGTDLSAVKSPSFTRMLKLGCEQFRYKIPTCEDLRGWILQEEVEEMQEYVREIRNSWASTGCSILLDGWRSGDQGQELINVLVYCPRGTIYLRSSASTESVGAIVSLLDEVVEEVGVKNVVQIVSYSTSACMEAVGKQLMEKYLCLFWTVSASHCIELMLEKIGKTDFIHEVLKKAKIIIRFIYNRAPLVQLLRNHTYGDDLVKSCTVRAATPFLTLEKILCEEESLKKMFRSSGWSTSIWASTSAGKAVVDLVEDAAFWTGAMMALKATIPLVRVLDLINAGEKQQLGYIYETMDQAKETIKEEFKKKKSQYMPFWKNIDEIWNKHLHSPLHAAGYFLNPSIHYSRDFFPDGEVTGGLFSTIIRMAEDRRVQELAGLQLNDYKGAKGDFGRASNMSPALWWSAYGGHCPELQRVAVRTLSQTCNGASVYGLKKSVAETLLLSKEGRNPVEQQRLSDLTFVHYNLHLRSFNQEGLGNNILLDGFDPMHEWIVDQTPSD